MAQQKEARVVSVVSLSATTCMLELEPTAPLDFVGGQYLIVNSGIELPDGKLAKRAYSILSGDARQERVTVAVKNIDGPGSAWMHARAAGDVVPFSGPWGKWLPDDTLPRRTLVVATDTGITAALGLVSARAFAPQRVGATLVWLAADDYFLPEVLVRAFLPAGVSYRRAPLPPVGHPERVAAAESALAGVGPKDSVFLVGDGAVVFPLRDRKFTDAKIECFFNNPAKKS
jgi:NADPH-dependent ferric siderophore reductase